MQTATKTGLSSQKICTLTKCRSHGPVSNLEDFVPKEWWRHIFNSYYLKTDADVVDDAGITAREIDLFSQSAGASRDERILDLSCGQGRHTLELARRGYKNVEGLDRSRYLIQRAKTCARKENLTAKFREGDARKLPYNNDYFDLIMILGNSFGYFETIQDDLKVLHEVFKTLRPGGKLLIDVADGEYLREKFQSRTWEWIDKNYFVCRERSLSLDKMRLISREVITHVEKGVIADQFYAERLYTYESLKELLETAGFSKITAHTNLLTPSSRNQDLGMMERRIIITAEVCKNYTPVRMKEKNGKNIVVLMGDPQKPDPLKPLYVFDDDDFDTIERLKKALGSLHGYHFIYLNNHDTFIHDLDTMKDSVDYVFNLCDEGFDNNARKELHVPSLLEILSIEYSGSGPQCLAYCYDKSLVRGIAKEMEIPVPEAFLIEPEDNTFDLPFSFPLIAKPNFGDSSFGITQKSVATSIEELVTAISSIRNSSDYDKPILVEELLQGKDISVGIIGNLPDNYMVLPIIEEDYSSLPAGLPKICGYEAKWIPDSPYWKITSIEADLPEATQKFVIESCLKLFERLECRDYCRFDWRMNSQGIPKLLEVNPNPGWCWDGHLAKMARIAGMSYQDMLQLILQTVEQRIQLKSLQTQTVY